MYVHLMEMSPHPERALRAADRLRTAVPDAGHLVHMPTHIDVLCGLYKNVCDWNGMAVAVDRKYLDAAGSEELLFALSLPQLSFPALRRDVPRPI